MSDLPLRVLDRTAFERLRALLANHDFTEAGVCAHTGSPSMYDFETREVVGGGETPMESGLDVLVRLFLDSESVPVEGVDRLLGASGRDLLEGFGLLRRHPEDPAACFGTVLLYPTEDLWIVSDRSRAAPAGAVGSGPSLRADAVYPALTSSVRVFLSTLPRRPSRDFLELCSGTGIAALIGARAGAGRAWAVDITERSTAFARFNARLNDLPQVEPLRGDLWAPVAGRTFDTIVAHPPYVPSAAPEFVYRDGGDDGERITGAILEGLSAHLARGGVFHCTCTLAARAGRSVADRVRTLLGAKADAFDLVLLRNGSLGLYRHFQKDLASSDPARAARAAAQLRGLRDRGVESLDFCTLVLRRHGESRPGFTVQVERGENTRWKHVAWALEVGAGASDPDRFAARILDTRVSLSTRAELDVHYRLGGRRGDPWVPTSGRIRVDQPFPSSVAMAMDDATLLARFDGSRTLRQHLAELQSEGRLPMELDTLDFARSFAPLVLAGIVDTEAFPLP